MRVAIVDSNDGYDALYIDGHLVYQNHGISVAQVFQAMLEHQEQILKDNESLKDLVHALKLDLDWYYLGDDESNVWAVEGYPEVRTRDDYAGHVGGFPEWEKDLDKPW